MIKKKKKSSLRIRDRGGKKSVSLDTKAHNATKVQNDTILIMTDGGERKENADCFSQSCLLSIGSFVHPSVTDIHPSVLFSL